MGVVSVAVLIEAACTHGTLDLSGGIPSGAWWNDDWAFREPVDVTAATAVVPSGYSVALSFDHAALVSAGHAAADGSDLRIVEDVGGVATELDRIVDDASNWNAADTTLWFRTRETIPAGEPLRVWLYYGNPSAGAPPADPNRVWLFFDDFESGLSRWNPILDGGGAGGYWSISTQHSRSGASALRAGAVGSRRVIVASDVDETDLAWSAWWYVTASTSLDFSQVQRSDQTQPLNMVKTNFYSADGWDVSTIVDDAYTQVSPPIGGPIQRFQWTQVTTLVLGTNERVLVDGVQVSPDSGWTSVGSVLRHGAVGFQDANVPSSRAVYLDDVAARRYVEPEPVASAGAEEPHP